MQMKVTYEQLLQVIGAKEVQIQVMTEKIQELEKKLKETGNHDVHENGLDRRNCG